MNSDHAVDARGLFNAWLCGYLESRERGGNGELVRNEKKHATKNPRYALAMCVAFRPGLTV